MVVDTTSWNLFSDALFSSTDLSRKTGDVLNRARRSPVTISRSGEQFALLRREQAAELVEAVSHLGPAIGLVQAVLDVVEGEEPPNSLLWLKAFDQADLRTMMREVLETAAAALHETKDWDAVNAVVHEWHESALVAESRALDEALSAASDPVPLPPPETASTQERSSNDPRAG